jgi:lipopolysaccharide export system permease protein
MLKKIDLYIIKKYMSTFLFTTLIITAVALNINFFENVDRFLAADTSIWNILKYYHLNYIPWINGILWPLFSLITVIFFTSRLARESEYIAMLSAGMSYERIMRPYILASSLLAILLWMGNSFIIPTSNRIKNIFESEYLKRGTKSTLPSDRHFFISPNEKAYFRLYSEHDSTIFNLRIETMANNKLIYVLKADKAMFFKDSMAWKLFNYETRSISDEGEKLEIYQNKELIRKYPFYPQDFIRYTKQMEMMNSSDLRDFIKSEQDKGLEAATKYKVELYRRTADPFTIIILTIIGASVASRKVRGGLGFHLAIGVIIGACFVILSKFTTTFALTLGIPPLLGVWLPNMIFGLISLYLYRNAQK